MSWIIRGSGLERWPDASLTRFGAFRHRFGRPWVVGVVAVPPMVAGLAAAVALGLVKPRLDALETDLADARQVVREAHGELALLEMQNEKLREVQDYSTRYGIPADLASSIYEIGLAERLDVELAFRLVKIESAFQQYAVSGAGAVGYTQLLPSTARWLDASLEYSEMFERETNLRLGFRYLRQLLDENAGDMRLALLAYNRGPGRVRSIVSRGGNPSNGYARQILGGE